MATIPGGQDDDVLVGTRQDDFISDDQLAGGAGRDVLMFAAGINGQGIFAPDDGGGRVSDSALGADRANRFQVLTAR